MTTTTRTPVSSRWAGFDLYDDLAWRVRRSHGDRSTLGTMFLVARANSLAPRGATGLRKADLEYRLRVCADCCIQAGY